MPLELLKTECRASWTLPYPSSKGPTLCLKVTVTLNRKKSPEISFSVALKVETVVLEGGINI